MPLAEQSFQIVNWYVNVDKPAQESLRISADTNIFQTAVDIVENDKFELRIRFYNEVAGVMTITQFPTATTLVQTRQVDGTTHGFLRVASGDGISVAYDTYYQAIVNTATAEMATYKAARTSDRIIFNIQLEDIEGVSATRRKTVAYFEANLLADAFSSDSDPTAATVTKIPASFVVIANSITTMVAGGRYALDTTATTRTITLPLTPSIGDTVELFDAQGTWATNNGTLARNGKKLEGATADLTLDVSSAGLILEYVGGAKEWRVN
jgi:hypothetical protein